MAGRTFAGMVFPDSAPLRVDAEDVKRVHMFDVPTRLRDHADARLSAMSGDDWWTVGEFRYANEPDYDTAVARWTRHGIQFGIERCE